MISTGSLNGSMGRNERGDGGASNRARYLYIYPIYISYFCTTIVGRHVLFDTQVLSSQTRGIFLRLSAAAGAVTKVICVARPDSAMISLNLTLKYLRTI